MIEFTRRMGPYVMSEIWFSDDVYHVKDKIVHQRELNEERHGMSVGQIRSLMKKAGLKESLIDQRQEAIEMGTPLILSLNYGAIERVCG